MSIWENVNVILRGYTAMFVPNLRSTSLPLKYADVQRWTIVPTLTMKTWAKLVALPAHLRRGRPGHELLLARRHALPPLHPLDERGLGVADGPADPDVGRAVAAHARLGQPGQADLQQPGRL